MTVHRGTFDSTESAFAGLERIPELFYEEAEPPSVVSPDGIFVDEKGRSSATAIFPGRVSSATNFFPTLFPFVDDPRGYPV